MTLTDYESVAVIIGTVIAGLAVFGPFAFWLYVRLRQRKLVTVVLRHGKIGVANGTADGVYVRAVNTGTTPITLVDFRILLPKGETQQYSRYAANQAIPCTLPPGNMWEKAIPAHVLFLDLAQRGYQGKVSIRCVFEDAVGERYFSKPLAFQFEVRQMQPLGELPEKPLPFRYLTLALLHQKLRKKT